MSSKFCFIIIAISLLFCPIQNSFADVNIGISADNSGIREFHLAIGDFYRVSEKKVVKTKRRGVHDDEIPVVFHIAKRSNVDPSIIIDMRLGGKSWMDISLHYGLSAEIFYVDAKNVSGPPYGRALGHYKNKRSKEWGSIRLSDNDVINLVNLKFLSKHYGYSPDQIIKMKSQGESFAKINQKVKKSKSNQKAKSKANSSKGKSKAKNKRK